MGLPRRQSLMDKALQGGVGILGPCLQPSQHAGPLFLMGLQISLHSAVLQHVGLVIQH